MVDKDYRGCQVHSLIFEDEMKKILFLTTISGFLPQFESNDVKLLKEMGCEIHYASNFRNPIYTFDEEKLIKQGIIFHQIDIEKSPASTKNFGAIKQVIDIIDNYEIDIVHCHNPMGGVVARVAAKLCARKPYVIYTAHGFHFYNGAPIRNWVLYYTVEKFLARWTDQIITINCEDYERAKTFKLKDGGKVAQIHSVGVDENRFCLREKNLALRRSFGIPDDAFVIVTAAELNKNKNQKIVIDALAYLKNKKGFDISKVYYLICGKGPNLSVLERQISEYNFKSQVKLLGFRTDMPEILSIADVFAFPSHREGLGIAAVEALLCGVPLIVADNRGTREYAIDTVNSIVCRPDSVRDFANAIETLMVDKNYRDRLSKICRRSGMIFTVHEVEKTMKKVYGAWINR